MACLEIVFGIVCAIIAFTWWCYKRPENFPPGPLGLPVVGYFPFFGKYPHVTITKLSARYGSVCSMPFGLGRQCVVLNDWKSVKQALVEQSDVFSGRPRTFIIDELFREKDIASIHGELWKEKRRFTLQHLRDLGFGKTSMESIISEEVLQVQDRIDSNIGCKVSISDFLFLPILNIIWGLVAGKKYAMSDQKMQKFSETVKIIFDEMQNNLYLNAIPIARFIPGPIHRHYRKLLQVNEDLEQFLEDELKDHTETYREGVQRDFIDAYLSEIYRHRASGDQSAAFQEDHLVGSMKNFFEAGVETTLHTLSWAFLYMALWPEIQEKVQEELDRVIGTGRSPVYSDRSLLPYTEAVLLETHRYASIVPLSVPHENHTTTQLMGYTIPKKTFILQNIWAIHHDPEYWDEPELYRPERFIGCDGKVQRPEYFIPFSTGARACLGEPLARMELFLFFAAILHRYSLRCVTGEKPPSIEPVPSITLRPQPFGLVFKQRF